MLESGVAFSDVRVIFTDGVAGRSDEASTMGCGGQAQAIGQHPAETAGSGTDIAPNAMGSESNVNGDGNAFEQREQTGQEQLSTMMQLPMQMMNSTCDICKLPNAPESFLLCDECNKGYHTYCLQPALPSVPPLRDNGCVHHALTVSSK